MRRNPHRNHRRAAAATTLALSALLGVSLSAAPALAEGLPLRPPTDCASGAQSVFVGPCAAEAALTDPADDQDHLADSPAPHRRSAVTNGEADEWGEPQPGGADPRGAVSGVDSGTAPHAAEAPRADGPHGELAGPTPTVVASARDLPAQCAALIGVGLVLLGIVRRLRRGRA